MSLQKYNWKVVDFSPLFLIYIHYLCFLIQQLQEAKFSYQFLISSVSDFVYEYEK